MNIKRTYFHDRIGADTLQAMMARRESFFLEQIADVDATAAQCAAWLRARGLVCQVRDQRWPPGRDMAASLAPGWLGLAVALPGLWRAFAARLADPRPHAVVVKRPQALDVQFTPRAQPQG